MSKHKLTNQKITVFYFFFFLVALIVIPFLLINFRRGDLLSSFPGMEKEKIHLVGKSADNFLPAEKPQIKIKTRLTVQEIRKRLIILDSTKMPVNLPFEISEKGQEKTITFLQDGEFKPGFYTLQINSENGINFKQDFTWGVLAINTNQSSYSPGQAAEIYMTVLDNRGKTVCDAEVVLTIISPSGKRTFLKTTDNTIEKSPECQPKNVTYKPDFKAIFAETNEKGKYRLLLDAKLNDGQRRIESELLVDDKQDFVITRNGPTRIYPINNFDIKIKIFPRKDFQGEVTEIVPASFEISNTDAQVELKDKNKTLTWKASFFANQQKTFTYRFKAPNISPEFYLLGPLKLVSSSNKTVFTEPRAWQIASDAPLSMILFLDGGDSVPTGWTCVSCSGGDTFYEKFPRGEASYGGTGGSDSHTHTISATSSTSQSSDLISNDYGGVGVSDWVHTHTLASYDYTTISNTGKNLPPYRDLKMIKYDSGVPTTIPQNAIAIFNDSLPAADWSAYTSENNYYLRGGGSTSTGGSNTHTHQPTIFTGTPSSPRLRASSVPQVGVAADTHTHSGNNQTNAIDLKPNRISVILGKASTDTTIPTNMIALFDDTPTSEWQVLSSSGGDFYQRFFYGGSIYGDFYNNANNASHNHNNLTVTTGGPSATNTSNSTDSDALASSSHTHTIGISFTAATNSYPPYVNVIVARYGVYDSNMLIFEDTTATPSGWLCVSCQGGDPFYSRYPRGEATYGGTGGAETHTHTSSFSVAANTSGLARANTYSSTYNATNHTHTVSTYSFSAASNLPSSKNLKVLRYNNGIPSSIPAYGIVMFDTSVPSGWTRYSAQDTYYIRGGVDVSTTGSDTHTHTVSFTTGGPSLNYGARDTGAVTDVVSATHTHTGSASSGSGSNEPPKVVVVLGYKTSSVSLPTGMIAMFDNPPGPGWDVLSDSGDTFYQKFLEGDSSYSTSAITGSHTHADFNINSGYSGIIATFDMARLNNELSINHTHTVSVSSISSESTLAPYINVIIAKRLFLPPSNCYIVESLTNDNLTLYWTDQSTTETRFLIQISTDSASFTNYAIKDADTTSHLDTNTASGHTYAYQVRAEEGATTSDWCTTMTGDTLKGNFKFEGVKMEGVKINFIFWFKRVCQTLIASIRGLLKTAYAAY